jgi:hypothetical protein
VSKAIEKEPSPSPFPLSNIFSVPSPHPEPIPSVEAKNDESTQEMKQFLPEKRS